MLIGLIIGIVILAVMLTFFMQKNTSPVIPKSETTQTQIEQMEQQVEEYKQNLYQQEEDIFNQIKNTK